MVAGYQLPIGASLVESPIVLPLPSVGTRGVESTSASRFRTQFLDPSGPILPWIWVRVELPSVVYYSFPVFGQ